MEDLAESPYKGLAGAIEKKPCYSFVFQNGFSAGQDPSSEQTSLEIDHEVHASDTCSTNTIVCEPRIVSKYVSK